MKSNRGFTLIELVLVITILGILAISALPQFFAMSTQAEDASRDGVVGAVRAAISLKAASNLVATPDMDPPYPATLGNETTTDDCSQAGGCFGLILTNPVTDTNWSRSDATTYIFSGGTTPETYVYTAETGMFE